MQSAYRDDLGFCPEGAFPATSSYGSRVTWTPEKQRWLEESCRASGVPLKVTDPHTLAKVAVLLRAGGSVPTTTTKVDIETARELIAQGYHVEQVIKKTGVPVEMLKSLVGPDGYKRGA